MVDSTVRGGNFSPSARFADHLINSGIVVAVEGQRAVHMENFQTDCVAVLSGKLEIGDFQKAIFTF